MLRLFPEVRRQPAALLFATALLVLGPPLGGIAIAQSDNRAAGTTAAPGTTTAPADAVTPVEEFSKQVEEFKKSYPELNKKIEDSAKSIDAITDIDKARTEIEELRSAVAGMLGAVSDNGRVSQLGAKALAHARSKIKELEQGARFKPEERDFLLEQWRKLVTETERANDDLDSARKEFADLLRTLQTREDFVDELMQIRRATEALDVIRNLTRDIRDASGKLRTLIGGIKPPGV
jgi:DNA repair exonuclease SbcCD ATPase subunit